MGLWEYRMNKAVAARKAVTPPQTGAAEERAEAAKEEETWKT